MNKLSLFFQKSLGLSWSKAFLFFLLTSLPLYSAQAEGYFAYSPAAQSAYLDVLALRFDQAQQKIDQLHQREPDNLVVYHIENYIDLFRILINEEEEEFERLVIRKDRRLAAVKKGDSDSPYYAYIQAEIKLQWALARLKFDQYFTAFGEVRSAYKLLTKNQKRFPDFLPNKKSLGILHAMIGTVPDNYRWGLKLLGGMEGSIEQGRKGVEEVLHYAQREAFLFEEETAVLYAMLLLHLKNQGEEAWLMIQSAELNPLESPLACFVLANVAMHTGRNDEAIRLLEQRPTAKDQHPFYYLDYMLGLAKLYRLDEDARPHFEHYLQQFNGRNYIKEAHQKIAWYELLQGNTLAYEEWIKACLKEGCSSVGGDKQALNEARNGRSPHPELLRARLLFDGGYYQRAYDLLSKLSVDQFRSKRLQIEYYYRLGRVCHYLPQHKLALEYYTKTIQLGRYHKAYFACNAALKMGLLLEQKGRIKQAQQYYESCLAMRPEEYASGLHQQAKAGLNRLR
ncbi:MAG: tetratricopeptide repeat protein [Bacteroidota bacterium]